MIRRPLGSVVKDNVMGQDGWQGDQKRSDCHPVITITLGYEAPIEAGNLEMKNRIGKRLWWVVKICRIL